jgi:hypothetical protein
MLSTFTPSSEPLLKAVSSANSEALVVNGKNNSSPNKASSNDFKSALNQAEQQAPQQAETRGEQVNRANANKREANHESIPEKGENTPSPEQIALSTTVEASLAVETTTPSTGQENTAVLNVEALMAFAYVTPVPPMTLALNAPVEELSHLPTPEPSFQTAVVTPVNPLELTPIDEVNPAVVEEALAAMKLQANQKSVSVDGNVLQNVSETSPFLKPELPVAEQVNVLENVLQASPLVETPSLLISTNPLEASLKAGEPSKALPVSDQTSAEAPLSTKTSSAVEQGSATLQGDSTQEDGLLKDENTPTEETVILNAPVIDPSLAPTDAFTPKSIEGVLNQNIVEQGIQPLGLQVVRGIQSAYDSASKTMQVQLNPEDLGHMRIQIKQVGEGLVSARLVVERPEAVEQVKTQLQDLQRSLEQQGLKMDKIDIVLAGANNPSSSDSNKESKNDGKEQKAFQDNPSGGFQQSAQEEQRQAFQEDLQGVSLQGVSLKSTLPVENQAVQARLEELNSLRQSYQTYKQQSLRESPGVSTPEQPKNQIFSPVQQAGLNVLA